MKEECDVVLEGEKLRGGGESVAGRGEARHGKWRGSSRVNQVTCQKRVILSGLKTSSG